MNSWVLSLRPESPSRPPDWRWQLAKRMLTDRREVSREYGDAVKWAYGLAVAAAHFKGTGDDWALLDWCNSIKHPIGLALIDCWDLYEKCHPQDESRSKKRELEARILALQPAAEIAHHMVLTELTVLAYESIFFNVFDRINSVSWILHNIFGSDHHNRSSESDYGLLWKLGGYFGGPLVVDALVSRCGMSRASTPQDVYEQIKNDRDLIRILKTHTATRTMPINGFTAAPLLEFDLRSRTEEAKLGQNSGNATVDALSQVLQAVAWGMQTDRNSQKYEPRVVIADMTPEGECQVDWDAVNPFDRPKALPSYTETSTSAGAK